MKITITKNEKEFDCTAAWRIIGQMLNEPESVIGLRRDVLPVIFIGWWEKSILNIRLRWIPLLSSDWMR